MNLIEKLKHREREALSSEIEQNSQMSSQAEASSDRASSLENNHSSSSSSSSSDDSAENNSNAQQTAEVAISTGDPPGYSQSNAINSYARDSQPQNSRDLLRSPEIVNEDNFGDQEEEEEEQAQEEEIQESEQPQERQHNSRRNRQNNQSRDVLALHNQRHPRIRVSRSGYPLGQEMRITAQIRRVNSNHNGNSRRRTNPSTVNHLRARRQAPQTMIRSMAASQNQIRQIICLAISLCAVFVVVFFVMRNMSRNLNIIWFFCLFACLLYLYLRYQRIRDQQQLIIHENSYFSYTSQDPVEPLDQIEQQMQFPRLGRPSFNHIMFPSDDHFEHDIGIPGTRGIYGNAQRQADREVTMNFIMQAIRNRVHQILAEGSLGVVAESGFSDSEITEIGGAQTYAELKSQQNEAESSEDSCVVCLDGFTGESQVRILKCKHFFHQLCVDEWLKKKRECPVCRQPPLDRAQVPHQFGERRIEDNNPFVLPPLFPANMSNEFNPINFGRLLSRRSNQGFQRRRIPNTDLQILYLQ